MPRRMPMSAIWPPASVCSDATRKLDAAMPRLDRQVAMITGAVGGIGSASAELFAQEGARLVLLDVAREAGERLAARLRAAGADCLFLKTDVTDDASIKDAVEAALGHFGKIDVLFNVAGGSATTDAPADKVDLELWDKTIDLDLKGTFLCCRHAVKPMIAAGRGVIVNTSSWAALRHFQKHVYVAAKGGVISLTRSLAGEYAKHGVRVNVICPGGVRSERNQARFGPGASMDEARLEARRRMLETYPYFVGDPIDIANVALFLASDESRMITGATIPADGGRSCY
ncbi:SDR family NAD(P)-dependent oxidoreductase [Roseiarcaceae bacterium H3SJ34-1]|uniref:SDR family NAD(P)-dependent oxidoreductase n=1 Tax=Terripilifer ovatus TaxID=3032367 RepID=UPI003AB9A8A1|nr:SDR family NAD(P)-dependent oxidoreductase [Roseiarcaceae bacterium H3SJ34-1]